MGEGRHFRKYGLLEISIILFQLEPILIFLILEEVENLLSRSSSRISVPSMDVIDEGTELGKIHKIHSRTKFNVFVFLE